MMDWTQRGSAGVPMHRGWRLSRKTIGQFIMTLGFFASFVPYVTGTSTTALVSALVVFLLAGGVVVPLFFHDRISMLLRRLLKVRFAIFALLLPIGPSIVAASTGAWDALFYAVLMTVTLTVCQITLGGVSLRRLLQAFATAGGMSVALFAVADWHGIVHAATSSARLIPPHAQPNAIGFIFAGSATALAWCAMDRNSRRLLRIGSVLAVLLAVAVIFLAQSRASLLALACGAAFAAGAYGSRVIRRRKLAARGALVLAAVLLVGLASVLIARPSYANRAVTYAAKMLRLQSQYRGVGSGLSGRIPRWRKTIETVDSDSLWVFGAGYRTSTKELGFSVDNGYLTILYEEGLVGLLAVLVQLLWLWSASARSYLYGHARSRRNLMLTVLALSTVLLVNNGFDRYLFGLGNPFSLIGLMFLLIDRDVLAEAVMGRLERPVAMGSSGRIRAFWENPDHGDDSGRVAAPADLTGEV